MNDERVFQLLVETNPVPDSDALDSPVALAQLERRSPTMATEIEVKAKETRPVRELYIRSRLLIGAATAVLALIVGIGTWAIIGGDGDVALDPRVEVVHSAIDAWNRGDIVGYKAHLTGADLNSEETVHLAEALSHANLEIELDECVVTGNAPGGESIVECASTETDDFYGAGAIVTTGTRRFHVTEDGRISNSEPAYVVAGVNWVQTGRAMFNIAFWSWLEDAHPTVFDDIGPDHPDKIPGLSFPASINFGSDDLHEPVEMLTALEYVDEFVAQSDVYPLSQ